MCTWHVVTSAASKVSSPAYLPRCFSVRHGGKNHSCTWLCRPDNFYSKYWKGVKLRKFRVEWVCNFMVGKVRLLRWDQGWRIPRQFFLEVPRNNSSLNPKDLVSNLFESYGRLRLADPWAPHSSSRYLSLHYRMLRFETISRVKGTSGGKREGSVRPSFLYMGI